MPEQDDGNWIEGLAGKPPAAGAERATVAEAQAVRKAMLAARAADEGGADLDVEPGLQRLLFRLRQEKLAGAGSAPKRLYAGLALAASLVLVVGIVTLQREPPTGEDGVVFRGGPGAQMLISPDPGNLAQAMNADLDTLELEPIVTRFGANATVEAKWPLEQDARHTAFLKRFGLAPPKGDRLKVEIRPGK